MSGPARFALLALLATTLVCASAQTPDAGVMLTTPVGSEFRWVGQITRDSVPVTGFADLRFSLWDARKGGTPRGLPISFNSVAVADGLYEVTLDFGFEPFNGDALWVETLYRYPSAHGQWITLPRKVIGAWPYAQYALDAVRIGGWPVSPLEPGEGQVLKWNATTLAWEPAGVTSEMLADGAVTLPKLSAIGPPEAGDVLAYDGAQMTWAPPPQDAWSQSAGGIYYNAGNVGIGTSTPQSPLEIAGVVHSNVGGFKFPDGSLQTSAWTAATGPWLLGDGGIYYPDGGVAIGLGQPPAEIPDAIQVKALLPSPRGQFGMAVVPATGKMYMFGGQGAPDQIVEYDAVQNLVTVKSAVLPRTLITAACAADPRSGKIYLLGGQDAGGADVDQIFEYDPVADQVTTMSATLPSARHAPAAAADPRTGKIYCFGGWPFVGNQIVEYDAATDQATLMTATLPAPTNGMAAVADPRTGKLYVLGGWYNGHRNQIQEYDPATNQAVLMSATLTQGMEGVAAAADPRTGLIYGFGGSPAAGVGSDQIFEFDAVTDQLVIMPAHLPVPISTARAAADPQTGRVYCAGGQNYATGELRAEILEYAPPILPGLSVAGLVESTAFGFRFPDGTIQTTAVQSGGLDGGGTMNAVPKFIDPTTLGDSAIIEVDGNVGIGTETPGSALTVAGQIETLAGGIKFPDGTVQMTAATGGELGGGGTVSVVPKFTDPTTLGDSAIVEVNGDVGIGTDAPEARLDVRGATRVRTLRIAGEMLADASVLAWGDNWFGQCNVPVSTADYVAVAAGIQHSLALRADGSIVAWQWNESGQCDVPLPNLGFTAVSAGYRLSLGLRSDGSVAAWGDNSMGQCSVPAPNSDFVAIAAGMWHSLALKANGSIAAWGSNFYGQIDVPGPNANFVAIAAGYYHSVGVKADGSVVAWGQNYYGQCTLPTPNAGFIAVAGGWGHTLGLETDGSIVAWGWNGSGECDVPSPNTGFTVIAAGGNHSMGLKADGSIVAWGMNAYGQCNIPAPNSGFVAIGAGNDHSVAIRGASSTPALWLEVDSAYKPGSEHWTISSDRRLKQNIQPLGGALDRVLQLRGVSFEWRNPLTQGGHFGPQIGLIADEVAPVFPDWVGVGPDGYQTLTIGGFEALTVEALRELQSEQRSLIEELRRENAALRARMDQLEISLPRTAPAQTAGSQ